MGNRNKRDTFIYFDKYTYINVLFNLKKFEALDVLLLYYNKST